MSEGRTPCTHAYTSLASSPFLNIVRHLPFTRYLLTDEQSEAFERMHRMSLKTIFSLKAPYRKCLARASIATLWERREELFRNFAHKAHASQHFGERWFQPEERSRSRWIAKRRGSYPEILPCYKMEKQELDFYKLVVNNCLEDSSDFYIHNQFNDD